MLYAFDKQLAVLRQTYSRRIAEPLFAAIAAALVTFGRHQASYRTLVVSNLK